MKNSDKREEIMQAALELIAEHGFHGAPMAMIAEKAGVGAGTIYRYFRKQGCADSRDLQRTGKKSGGIADAGYSRDRSLRSDSFISPP